MIDPEQFQALLAAIVALITAIMAIIQNWEKNKIISAMSDPLTVTPSVAKELPPKTWRMSEETKRFLTAGRFQQNAAGILAQVAANEALGNADYWIDTGIPSSSGGNIQYHIQYGLLAEQLGNT